MIRKFWNWIKNDVGGEEERTLVLNGEISDETWYGDEVTPALFAKELNAGSGNITVHRAAMCTPRHRFITCSWSTRAM